MKLPLSGVFAALVTPIDDHGRPDLAAFDRVSISLQSAVSMVSSLEAAPPSIRILM